VSVALPTAAIAAVGLVFWLAPRPTTPADLIEHVPSDLFERPPLSDDITFATPIQAEQRRTDLRRFVFGRAGLPRQLPDVDRGIRDAVFSAGLPNLDRIDRLTIALPRGFTSVAYHVVPRQANGRLLIYHNGHNESLLHGKWIAARFLERGYAVLVFAMPLTGFSTNPVAVETQCGRVELAPTEDRTVHDTFACLEAPLRYFLEPVVVALNYTRGLHYEHTAMVGLSGGGWTTVLSAALDPRVDDSYPVAGSEPAHIAARGCPDAEGQQVAECFGDFEQRWPDLYRVANYLELYVLGGWGPGRRQLAIYNVFEPCCFEGTAYEEWRPRVRSALRRLGSGEYAVVGDRTHHTHQLSPFALRVIEADLEGG
jgi:dienelactone hydrolase